MNSKFFDMKKEKQDRIINAALKVFALQGYRHASTDDIVREAAISKGLLFHYFESKLGTYQFVYEYSVRYMKLEISSCVDGKESDLFEVMKQVELARLHAMRAYPYMQYFLNRSASEDCTEALVSTEDKRKIWDKVNESVNAHIDYKALPEGIDGKKLQRMLDFTLKGLLADRFLDASFQAEMLYEESLEYLDMAKKMVYR